MDVFLIGLILYASAPCVPLFSLQNKMQITINHPPGPVRVQHLAPAPLPPPPHHHGDAISRLPCLSPALLSAPTSPGHEELHKFRLFFPNFISSRTELKGGGLGGGDIA